MTCDFCAVKHALLASQRHLSRYTIVGFSTFKITNAGAPNDQCTIHALVTQLSPLSFFTCISAHSVLFCLMYIFNALRAEQTN